MRALRLGLCSLLIGWASSAQISAHGAPGPAESGLIRAVGSDPSFKVRMQALRILTDRLIAAKAPAPDEAIDAMSRSASTDDNYLVRGLAAFSLGRLKDSRGRSAVEGALKDVHPFVRAQAEQALRELATPSDSQPSAGTVVLVAVEGTPEVTTSAGALDRLKSRLETALRAEAASQFSFVESAGGRGFKLRGSIAERKIEDVGGGSLRVTMVVRVAIVTWPEGNLRHIVSARASAAAKAVPGPGVDRLEGVALDAAADKAVKDALAEIRRG